MPGCNPLGHLIYPRKCCKKAKNRPLNRGRDVIQRNPPTSWVGTRDAPPTASSPGRARRSRPGRQAQAKPQVAMRPRVSVTVDVTPVSVCRRCSQGEIVGTRRVPTPSPSRRTLVSGPGRRAVSPSGSGLSIARTRTHAREGRAGTSRYPVPFRSDKRHDLTRVSAVGARNRRVPPDSAGRRSPGTHHHPPRDDRARGA